MKSNLHLFQRCHKNAYKEQAHDWDLQWLHSPQATVAFKGLCSPARDISQYRTRRRREGLPLPTLGVYVLESLFRSTFVVSHSPESFSTSFLHLLKALLMTIKRSGPSEAFSVSTTLCPGHLPEKPPAGECQESGLGARRRWLGHEGGAITQAHRFPCRRKHTGNTRKGSQIHTSMNCRGEAVQYCIIKGAIF